MSTPTECHRADLSCQPDRTIIAPKPDKEECAAISEKQFMKDHTTYSAISSWLFAISGATNIGVISVFASKVLGAVERGQPIFKSTDPKVPAVFGNKKYNLVALGATAFGGLAMGLSNWLESKKVVTEWQLGAGKLQRKAAGAERELEHATPIEQVAVSVEDEKVMGSVQTKLPERQSVSAERVIASIVAFIFIFVASLPHASYAFNDIEEEYQRDKRYALTQLKPEFVNQCLEGISNKINASSPLQLIGTLKFDDEISRGVYKDFYWNKSDRGIAFVMPVQAVSNKTDNITADIACFYSMTDKGLEFQQAEQIFRHL